MPTKDNGERDCSPYILRRKTLIVNELHTKIDAQRTKREAIYADFAKDNKVLHQLIDLALLGNGMLKGEALSKFIKRSVDLIK